MDNKKLEKYIQTFNEDLLLEYINNNVDISYHTFSYYIDNSYDDEDILI
jgi:hypothetical protein